MPDRPASVPRVYILTLGCPKNDADSRSALRRLTEAHVFVVGEPEEATHILVNTCGFIQDAKEESIAAILDACAGHPDKEVLAMGCLVERYRTELEQEIPEVAGWFGLADTDRLVAWLMPDPEALGSGRDPSAMETLPSRVPRAHAYVKISDGCDESCSFCAIPAIKGAYHSLGLSDILAEATTCLDEGARELVLVGQDTAVWEGDDVSLTQLVDVLSEDDRSRWVRLMYLQPDHLSPALLRYMARAPRLCRYLDIPLQHASRGVLRRMGRQGDGSTYLELLAEARRLMPDVSVRSTFIVGFPGETEEQFEELLEFVNKAAFDYAGAFIYSPEEGTAAAELRPRVPKRIAMDRLNRLNAALVSRSESEHMRLVGTKVEVMIDSLDVEDLGGSVSVIARTAGQAPEVDGVTYIEGEIPAGLSPGDLVEVTIVGAAGFDMIGSLP